jgi:hypothetical protein
MISRLSEPGVNMPPMAKITDDLRSSYSLLPVPRLTCLRRLPKMATRQSTRAQGVFLGTQSHKIKT